jgi:hypothetical protein
MTDWHALPRREVNSACRERGLSDRGSFSTLVTCIRIYEARKLQSPGTHPQDVQQKDLQTPSPPEHLLLLKGDQKELATHACSQIRIIPVVRESSLAAETQEEFRSRRHDHAVLLGNFFLSMIFRALHKKLVSTYANPELTNFTSGCTCIVDPMHPVLLGGVQSNTNVSTSNNGQVKILRDLLNVPYTAVLCSYGYDSATTNLPGYKELVKQLTDNGTRFHHFYFLFNDDYRLISASTITQAFAESPQSDNVQFLLDVARVGDTKAIVSEAVLVKYAIMKNLRHSSMPDLTGSKRKMIGLSKFQHTHRRAKPKGVRKPRLG